MTMTAIQQIRNAVEHALLDEEITIETYESLQKALAKGEEGFTIITMDSENILVIPLTNDFLP